MESMKCIQCNTETYQREGICVSCKAGITGMYKELKDLLRQDNRYNLIQKSKRSKRDKSLSKRLNNKTSKRNRKRR